MSVGPEPPSPARAREALIGTLVSRVTEAPGYKSALGGVLKRLCRFGDWSYAEAWIPTQDGRGLKLGPVVLRVRCPELRLFRQRGRAMGFRRGQGLPGEVFATGAPRWVARLEGAGADLLRRAPLARAAGLRAAAAFPVPLRGQAAAVLVFFAREERPPDPALVEKTTFALAALGPALEQKKVEMNVRARARQQEVVASIGLRALDKVGDIPGLLREAAALAAETVGTACAAVLEAGADGRLRLRTACGWTPDEAPPDHDACLAHVLAATEPVAVTNFRTETRFAAPPLFAQAGAVSALCAVIPGRARPLGVLCVLGTQPRRFPESASRFLKGLANVIGVALERDRAERELARHRAHLEELVDERTAALEATHEKLRQAERLSALATLARGITHDMNNVMLPALCRLDAIEASGLRADAAAAVEGVRGAFEQLRRLARGLQIFAVNPEEGVRFPATTRLDAWWKEVGELLRIVLPRTVALEARIATGLPPVAASAPLLTHAVLNLVTNAGEAIRGAGRVEVHAEAEGARFVRVSVRDSGPGMPPEVRRRAVEPLFTTKTRSLGTGLGLAMVRGFACSVGGSLSIDSGADRGTTVTLLLPAAGGAPEAPAPAAGARCAEVVLADRRAQAFVTSLLESAGFEVVAGGARSLLAVWDGNGNLSEVRRYLADHPARRVLLIGRPTGLDAKDPGARLAVVAEPGNLEAVRRALGGVVQELLEITDDAP